MRTTKARTLWVALLIGILAGGLWWLFRGEAWRQRSATAPSEDRSVTPPTLTGDLAQFQGVWEFVSLEVDGIPKPDTDFKKYTVVFAGDQWIVSEGTNIAAQTTIELDSTTQPKNLDVFPLPGKGQPIHGIYKFEGDKLTICDRGVDKGDRPTTFATEADSGLVLIVFQRTKP